MFSSSRTNITSHITLKAQRGMPGGPVQAGKAAVHKKASRLTLLLRLKSVMR